MRSPIHAWIPIRKIKYKIHDFQVMYTQIENRVYTLFYFLSFFWFPAPQLMALPERNHSPERLPVGRDERAAEQLKTARVKGKKREIVLNGKVIFSFLKNWGSRKLGHIFAYNHRKEYTYKKF